MQVLTLAGVKKAARDYYQRGKLTARHKDPLKRECVYHMRGGYRCAIGAALTRSSINKIDAMSLNRNTDVYGLLNAKIISCKLAEMLPIRAIQKSHDSWVYGTRRNENKFRQAIGLKPLKKGKK